MIFTNLALMYQDIEKQQPAINCLFEAHERNVLMYGADSLKVANSYQSLALAHFDINDFKKAVEFQQKSVSVLKNVLREEDPRVKDAETILEKIQLSIAHRNTQSAIQSEATKKTFGKPKGKKDKDSERVKEERKLQEQEALSAEEIQKAKVKKCLKGKN